MLHYSAELVGLTWQPNGLDGITGFKLRKMNGA